MAIVPLQIVSLLWSHPFITGLVILLFTTPLFHIVLFFTPLLMSTALCVIALVSIGPQIEKIREERQFKMSVLQSSRNNIGIVPIERPIVNRLVVLRQGSIPLQRRAGRWADWVKGIEIRDNTVWLRETHIMRDIADEGLQVDFSSEDGGIVIKPEDFSTKNSGVFTPGKVESAGGVEVEDEDEASKLALALVVKTPAEDEGKKEDDEGKLDPDTEEKKLDSLYEMVPVVESSAKAPPSGSRMKKKSWLRRRRIPCSSKALGQLRQKICSQIRRILS